MISLKDYKGKVKYYNTIEILEIVRKQMVFQMTVLEFHIPRLLFQMPENGISYATDGISHDNWHFIYRDQV
jgi:hypothetical protein